MGGERKGFPVVQMAPMERVTGTLASMHPAKLAHPSYLLLFLMPD